MNRKWERRTRKHIDQVINFDKRFDVRKKITFFGQNVDKD